MNVYAWRYQRFHISYLMGWLALGLLIGLLFTKRVMAINETLALFVVLVLCLGAFRSQRWWAVGILLMAGCILGVVRGAAVWTEYARYESLHDTVVELRGTMTTDPQVGTGQKQKLTLAAVSVDGTDYPGEVFVSLYSGVELKRGDTVTVRGSLRAGFASYGAALSSAKLVTTDRGDNVVRDIRERFSGAVRDHVIEPMASLGLGFVVGQRSTLPDELDEQLKVVGLTHIVVASGYNLTILVRFVMRLLSRYSRYMALVVSLLMIGSFVLFSGLSPSMNRAVIVTVLGLLAWYVGRRFHPLLLIGYVAASTAMVNPMYIWGDLGWYLSFLAFAGILILAPLALHLLYRTRRPSSFEQLVIETLSAEVMALPLIAFAFASVPVFGLVANVLVAPFIPAAMLCTALTGMIGMTGATFVSLIAVPTTLLIGYMIAVVEWLSALPVAQLAVDVGLGAVVLWYGALLSAGLIITWRIRYDFRSRDRMLEI